MKTLHNQCMENFTVTPKYQTRFIKSEQAGELINLFHLVKVPLSGRAAGRWERMIWASRQFNILHPEVTTTAVYKDLDGLLA